MACICDPATEPKVFPDNVIWILVEGRSNLVPRKTRFLGGKTLLEETPTATIRVVFKNEVDAAIFLEWFVTELDYGTQPFTIRMPFFGMLREWNVVFAGEQLREEPIRSAGEVELQLKIVDDLETVIAENTYTGECET